MLNPQKSSATHADSFLQRYELLRSWALRLTERDQERADDLLHDTFIQFMLSQPALESINDLDGYLYVCLRNLHLSQMRRATRTSSRELSIVEYDSAEVGLWAIDPRDQIKTQDELRTVCHYACRRRTTSKAGSVLILRFFHGYYPDEVASILRTTRAAVKDRLRLARAEAKLYLTDPDRLNLLHDKRAEERPRAEVGRVSNDLLSELRHAIFDSSEGSCFPRTQLEEFYAPDSQGSLTVDVLAHLVTCATCLDDVNSILGLPPLDERYESDMTGKDTGKKGGPRGGPWGKGGGGFKESLSRYLRRAQQVYRHEPQELCVAVNGYLQSTQKISSTRNELTLIVDTAEQIGFVEVFSEQGIRLLLLNVEPLPAGPARQGARVELSEGRKLDASLSFSGAWPTLHVTYLDPLAHDPQEQVLSEDLPNGSTAFTKHVKASATAHTTVLKSKSPVTGRSGSKVRWSVDEWSKRIFKVGFWLRPVTITAVFAVLLTAGSVFLWRSMPTAPPSAAIVLQRATQAEELVMVRPDTVIHRTFQIEERRGSTEGEILRTQRVELWQSAAKAITARRLYDSSGRLLAGEWVGKDNVATIYHHGVKPQVSGSPEVELRLDRDNVWLLSPSAKDFSTIVGDPHGLTIEERANHYVLNFASGPLSAERTLVKATLVIGRDDLHAIEQTLSVQQNGEIRVYRFSETSFERRPVNAVAPAVFEPEPELLGEAEKVNAGERTKRATVASPSALPILATPELEIEVLRLLNSIGGDLSDQVSVARTSDGWLRIGGTVETLRRKTEILHALGPVTSHPAVKISVETVAEAQQRQSGTETPKTIELEQVEIAGDALPVEPDLRHHFAGKGLSAEQLDQEITKFASRIMRRSLQTRLNARTLKQTMNRFSPDDLRALTPEARRNLMALIRDQAASLSGELSALSNELRAVIPGVPVSVEPMEVNSDVDLLQAINRLGEFVSQADASVRTSFSLSSEGSGSAPVKDAQFWRSLKSAEILARKISRQ